MAAPPPQAPPLLTDNGHDKPSFVAQHNSKAKSFASLLKAPEKATIPIREATSYKGKPELRISKSEQRKMCEEMPFVLIGKFSQGRPLIETIRKFFVNFGLRGHFNISTIDARHVVIECDLEEDYTRIFSKEGLQIQNYHMRLTKWTPEFRPGFESPIVPVWVSFPLLPLIGFAKKIFFM